MDNDAKMLDVLGGSLVVLQTRFRLASLEDRAALRQPLQEALDDYAGYQAKLLNEGIITSDADLAEADKIANGIRQAAERQSFVVVIARVISFIAPRI